MDGLLDFSFNVHRLLVKDFDPLPVDRLAGSGLVSPAAVFSIVTQRNGRSVA